MKLSPYYKASEQNSLQPQAASPAANGSLASPPLVQAQQGATCLPLSRRARNRLRLRLPDFEEEELPMVLREIESGKSVQIESCMSTVQLCSNHSTRGVLIS